MQRVHIKLYVTLGLDPEQEHISSDDVKAAYRKKARECHPDKEGGSHEAMAEVVYAYGILKDPQKRAEYDATGDMNDKSSFEEPLAMELLAQVIEAALTPNRQRSSLAEAILGPVSESFEYNIYEDEDFLGKLRELCLQGKANVERDRDKHLAAAERVQKLIDRLTYRPKKRKKGDKKSKGHDQAMRFDTVGGVLRATKARHDGTAEIASQRLEEVEIVLDMLDHYEFSYTKPEPPVSEPRPQGETQYRDPPRSAPGYGGFDNDRGNWGRG